LRWRQWSWGFNLFQNLGGSHLLIRQISNFLFFSTAGNIPLLHWNLLPILFDQALLTKHRQLLWKILLLANLHFLQRLVMIIVIVFDISLVKVIFAYVYLSFNVNLQATTRYKVVQSLIWLDWLNILALFAYV
jgi:hypothetical protein